MIGTCATCQFSKAYADPRINRKGMMMYCGYVNKATHVNGICDEYTRDNVRLAQQINATGKSNAKCATCGYTQYAHALTGMRDKVCADFVFPALAKQDELFPVEAVTRKTSMHA